MRALLELARKSLVANFRPLQFPMKLSLMLTYNCNARCLTCNIWEVKDHSRDLTFDELDRMFARANRFSWIDLTGGEIFLRRDIADIAAMILDRCRSLYLLHFATNGFTPERIFKGVEAIVRRRPRKLLVTVSLDGDEEVHERVRGVPNGFAKTMETYKQLRSLNGPRFHVYLGMTVSDHNHGRFADTFAAARRIVPEIGHDDFHVNIAQKSAHFYGNADLETVHEREILETVREVQGRQSGWWRSPVRFLEDRYQRLAERYMATGRTPLPCLSLAVSCFVGPYGDVYPCHMYDKKLGNIRDHDYDLMAIWRRPETREESGRILRGECPQCWTPCEAYQTIIGNTLGLRGRAAAAPGMAAAKALPADARANP